MANSGVGLTTALMSGVEVTYGTAVALTRSHEILSAEMGLEPNTLQSQGLYASPLHLPRGSRRARTRREVTGSFSVEVPSAGFGRFLEHSIGGTPSIAQQGGTAAWLQTHAYGTIQGKYLTLQKQIRDATNTVIDEFTDVGCKLTEVEFSVAKDDYLKATFTADGRDENTSTAAGTPSYPAGLFSYHFGQVTTLSLGGTAATKVESCSIKLARTMKQDGFYLGSAGVKDEPVEIGRPAITGQLVGEFDIDKKTALYDRLVSDAGAQLILTVTGPVISGAFSYFISFTIPEVHILGETPKVTGPDLVMINAPFEASWDGTNADITVTYQSTDVAV